VRRCKAIGDEVKGRGGVVANERVQFPAFRCPNPLCGARRIFFAANRAEKNRTRLFLYDRLPEGFTAEFVIVCFSYMLGRIFDPSLLPSVTVDDSEGEQPIIAEKAEKKKPVAIDSMVFQNTNAAKSRLSGNVAVPDGYTKIAGFCFNGFGFMKNITLPDTLMAIGEYAFSECKRLKGVVLPESLKKIERGAFSQCSKLTVIKIPRGVLEVEDSTFEFCSSLETVELPDTCSSIGARAFSCCDKLRKLFIPESVKFIDAKAFEECPELTIRCYANSYVHKYCLKNEISCETVTKGADLTAKMIEEG
jgi:hypothetical protein